MLPEWMTKTEDYVPPHDGGAFYYRTLKSLGGIMSRLRLESGREGRFNLPAGVKLLLMIVLIILVSVTQNNLVIMAVGAVALVRLALMQAEAETAEPAPAEAPAAEEAPAESAPL